MGSVLITDILQMSPSFAIGELSYGDYPIFYKEMATGMNEMLVSINSNSDAITRNLELLVYFIDLTTALDFDVNQAVIDIYPVMFSDVYHGLNTLPRDETKIYPGVKAVNDYTTRYINSDLTYYLNNEVWPGECVPYEWARVSETTGEDISGWNICDPS